MFRFFKRRPASGGAKPSLDAVHFDTTGCTPQGEPQPGDVRHWRTPTGDGIGLYLFALPPDLPANAASVDELAAFYRALLGDAGGKLVEVNVQVVGGCPAVRTLVAVPQQPSGRIYLGTITLPFRDFSFAIKCQCAEREPTGIKEAWLVDRMLAGNRPVRIEDGKVRISGFDPDDPRYDAEFPNHPVARARQMLTRVAGSLVIAADVRALPGFALPLNPAHCRMVVASPSPGMTSGAARRAAD